MFIYLLLFYKIIGNLFLGNWIGRNSVFCGILFMEIVVVGYIFVLLVNDIVDNFLVDCVW